MRQLSGQDASFIYQEQPHAPLNGASLNIYDQSTARGEAFVLLRPSPDLASFLKWKNRLFTLPAPSEALAGASAP